MALVDAVIGKNVREFRELAGMSQAQLASMVQEQGSTSIYPQTLVKIEHGNRSVKFVEGLHIANALNVPPELLWKRPPAAVRDEAAEMISRQLQEIYEGASAVRRDLGNTVSAAKRLLEDDLSKWVRKQLEADVVLVETLLKQWLEDVLGVNDDE